MARAMVGVAQSLLQLAISTAALPVLLVSAVYVRFFRPRSKSHRLVWGPVPILNNKYWSRAMAECGWYSQTLMYPPYTNINKASDFDRYVWDPSDPGSRRLAEVLERAFGPYRAFLHSLFQYDVFHHPYSGGFLGDTPIWRFEAQLLHLAQKKVIIIAYGSDAYLYSQIIDPCLRHALLMSYPKAGRDEEAIARRVRYWTRQADIVMSGLMMDGLGRWDVLPCSVLTIDTSEWTSPSRMSGHDGADGLVRILHTPNHRGFKGTEFLIAAVRELQGEGLNVELVLLEGVQNTEVRRVMREEVDILAEQFIATGYALNAIEGMASGLPVLSNLENESYSRVLRRYSYLNECPIVSTTPETLTNNLRLLVRDPHLRRQLGRLGRQYVETYHSYGACAHLFGSIYRALDGEEIDLINLYHPLLKPTSGIDNEPSGRPTIEEPNDVTVRR